MEHDCSYTSTIPLSSVWKLRYWSDYRLECLILFRKLRRLPLTSFLNHYPVFDLYTLLSLFSVAPPLLCTWGVTLCQHPARSLHWHHHAHLLFSRRMHSSKACLLWKCDLCFVVAMKCIPRPDHLDTPPENRQRETMVLLTPICPS